MQRLAAFATLAALLAAAQAAQALSIYIPPLPERVGQAKAIIVGKVTAIEKDPVIAVPGPYTKEKVRFQVAVVRIEQDFLGAKGLTDLRVGFVPPPAPVADPNVPRLPYVGPPELKVGLTACFLLAAHPSETLFTAQGMQDVVVKNDTPEYAELLKRIRHLSGLLADPKASLSAKDAEDRFLTAGMLISRYRNFGVRANEPPPKTVAIDADENKLILAALRGADWNAKRLDNFTPEHVFLKLPLTEKEGWTRPQDFKQIPAAARGWLDKHAATYKIEKLAQ